MVYVPQNTVVAGLMVRPSSLVRGMGGVNGFAQVPGVQERGIHGVVLLPPVRDRFQGSQDPAVPLLDDRFGDSGVDGL